MFPEKYSWYEYQQKEIWINNTILGDIHEKIKPRNNPLRSHFKLTKDMSTKSEDKKAEMPKVPNASIVGSLMYEMVCMRPDIAHAIGVVLCLIHEDNTGKF